MTDIAPVADPGAGTPEPPKTEDRTFTQTELNAIIQDRLSRERGRFADYDALKDKAGKFDTAEAARLSDIEKAQQAATASDTRAAGLEAELKSERLRNAVYAESVKVGAIDPDAVLALLDRAALVDETGQPKGVADAITALLESKPYLKAQAPKPQGNIGSGARGTGPTSGTFTREQLKDNAFFEANRADIFKALTEGRITE